MKSIATAFDSIFFAHSNLGRVVTIRGRSYRVCCDCAATFDYSIDTISIRRRSLSPVQALCVVRLNRAQ